MDTAEEFMMTRPPTAARPLLGLTVLVVEDSRFASEALRLLCLRSGARIRRADSLHHARRHLAVYRPSVVIVDLGLPDGPGEQLLAELVQANPRVDVILATSGDPDAEGRAMATGADGFIGKPIASLVQFQQAILSHLPADRHPGVLHTLHDDTIDPDIMALHDDLAHVADVLSAEDTNESIDYLTQFLGGVARSAADNTLTEAVGDVQRARAEGQGLRVPIARLAAIVQQRLAAQGPL